MGDLSVVRMSFCVFQRYPRSVVSPSSPSSPPPVLGAGAAANRRMGDDEDGLDGEAGPALVQGWYHCLGPLRLTKPTGGGIVSSVWTVGSPCFFASMRVYTTTASLSRTGHTTFSRLDLRPLLGIPAMRRVHSR